MTIKIHTTDKALDKMQRHRSVDLWPDDPKLVKPDWLKVRVPQGEKIDQLKDQLREHKLVTVCEEASCPNLLECFSKGTATFMIMGDKCTRRCSFCDVAHGRPDPLDPQEPDRLANIIAAMQLRYVVITSVDRDDLIDGGAEHFARCIERIRAADKAIKIEILVPDFRKRKEKALDALSVALPDVFNHNLETIRRLYPAVRPGSDYETSLQLIKSFKERHPHIFTKSGIMLGLGEELEEVELVMHDLRKHSCDWITIGQYLKPSAHHYPVQRYVGLDEFDYLKKIAQKMGFSHVASGPLVRSSYHAEDFSRGSYAIHTTSILDHPAIERV